MMMSSLGVMADVWCRRLGPYVWYSNSISSSRSGQMSGSMYCDAKLGRYIFGLVLMVFVLILLWLFCVCVIWCVWVDGVMWWESFVRWGSIRYSTEVAVDAG
jgi:hypothetical protein